MKSNWTLPDSSLFFSKKDPSDGRLGDCVQSVAVGSEPQDFPPADLLLWGYPDDEGIKLNGGRIGAAEAPRAIRTVFYKMTPHVLSLKKPALLDAGDISSQISLKDRHDQGAVRAKQATDQNLAWVSFGGGHDYGYADGAGFLRSQIARGLRPVVLNFDAHLDVRPSEKNLNSGTPFYRLLTEFSGQFDLIEVGLQPHCNSRAHWDWALQQGAHLVSLSDIQKVGLPAALEKVLKVFYGRPIWVSLDIDAITSNEAPGCSQSWTTGLRTDDVMASLELFKKNFIWKSFSIYEVSPPLDSDLRTVKLAALFLHRYLSLQTGVSL
jgi:formiminoglutamase